MAFFVGMSRPEIGLHIEDLLWTHQPPRIISAVSAITQWALNCS